ncbi:hypothetical protein K1T71_010232 [Dendrolimus kikuchii]|uniref:Uncharacterized protein n=1 Tax=Dendrolimus kikuchii TaxID=765133 RepID=A0ACC1CR69_9NEOP|nr:hypothetical protein K1T71_010232 [Dendrolimus kikuchii]
MPPGKKTYSHSKTTTPEEPEKPVYHERMTEAKAIMTEANSQLKPNREISKSARHSIQAAMDSLYGLVKEAEEAFECAMKDWREYRKEREAEGKELWQYRESRNIETQMEEPIEAQEEGRKKEQKEEFAIATCDGEGLHSGHRVRDRWIAISSGHRCARCALLNGPHEENYPGNL